VSRSSAFACASSAPDAHNIGKVERSHRIDEEEFWGRYDGDDFDATGDALAPWERRYDHERVSMALQGRTLMEKLTAIREPRADMARAPGSIQ
jgi:hypothetical protein